MVAIQETSPKEWLTAKELGELLGVKRHVIDRLRKEGMPYTPLGGGRTIRYNYGRVTKWLELLEEQKQPKGQRRRVTLPSSIGQMPKWTPGGYRPPKDGKKRVKKKKKKAAKKKR